MAMAGEIATLRATYYLDALATVRWRADATFLVAGQLNDAAAPV